jgi:hypothetical protein
VAQIDAPLFEGVNITLFNQLIFDIRHLPRFVGHTSSFTPYNRAEMTFHDGHIVISLLSAFPRAPNLFRLELRCKGVDWQVSSMAQICGQCSFLLSGIEQLDIRGDVDLLGSTLQVDMDNTQWLELFHPFTAVQTLSISREFQPFIASALQGLSVESVSEVLPALGELHLERYQVSRPASARERQLEDIKSFITARQRSGQPVSVHLYLPVDRGGELYWSACILSSDRDCLMPSLYSSTLFTGLVPHMRGGIPRQKSSQSSHEG